MAHDDEPRSPREIESMLEQFYQEEAQAVDRRLERVWHRLEQRVTTDHSQQEALPQALPVSPHERRYHFMPNPLSRLHVPQHWSARVSALAAAALLVVLVGGLTAGLILVHRGGTSAQATKSPTATATSIPTPTPTPFSSSGLSFSTVEMKDATAGWATAYPNPFVSGAQTQVLHTSDGGIHWKNVTPKPTALLARSGNALLRPLSNGASVRTEDFLTSSVAWVLNLPNQFFKTTDGGRTWQPETAPGTTMRQFTFLDALHGWVITEDAGAVVVFRTADGGATWTRMQSSGSAFPFDDAFWGVRFLNLTTGWAAFINNTVGSSAVIYKTTDSGATWQLQQIAMPAGVIAPVFPSAPVFFNGQEGMMEVMFNGVGQFRPQTNDQPASGGSPEGLYVTHNGGTTWEGPIILQGLEFPDFIDVLHGWALNSTGSSLLASSDSGRTWTTVPTSSNFSEMSYPNFVSSQIGWALKYDPAGDFLLKTTDGGQTWTQLNVSISN